MPVRKASAVWEGDLKNGKGKARGESGEFEVSLSFKSRFEEERGSNPEELVGAAHAGCFSMALAHGIATRGLSPRRIKTTAEVSLDKTDNGFKISRIILNTEAEVPDMSDDEFQDEALRAKKNCPVSKALAGVEIGLAARLKKSS